MLNKIIWVDGAFNDNSSGLIPLVFGPSRVVFVAHEFREEKKQCSQKNRHLFSDEPLAFRCREQMPEMKK